MTRRKAYKQVYQFVEKLWLTIGHIFVNAAVPIHERHEDWHEKQKTWKPDVWSSFGTWIFLKFIKFLLAQHENFEKKKKHFNILFHFCRSTRPNLTKMVVSVSFFPNCLSIFPVSYLLIVLSGEDWTQLTIPNPIR